MFRNLANPAGRNPPPRPLTVLYKTAQSCKLPQTRDADQLESRKRGMIMSPKSDVRIFSVRVALALTAVMPGSAAGAAEPVVQPSVADLTTQLQAADAAMRLQAVEALAARGEAARPAAANLVRAVNDEDAEVRAAAVATLGQLAAEPDTALPALAARLGDETVTRRGPIWGVVGLALGNYGRTALPHVAPALKSESAAACRGALLAIDRLGKEASTTVPEVIVILQRNDPEVRIFAISALRAIGPDAKDATPELVKHLSSDDFHTQYWACRALGAIGPKASSATDELIRCLRTGVTSVRRNAAAALGNIGPDVGQPAADALIDALSDRIQPVRQNVVIALGQLKPLAAKAVPVIETMLQEPSKFTPRAKAAKTLWQLDPQSKTPVEALLRDLVENDEPWVAAEVFGEIKVTNETVQRLTALLDSPNVWTKQYAAVALLEIATETQRAKATLEELARSENEETRETAAASLEKWNVKPSPPQNGPTP
jgi:HEAT repeat protein